MKFQIFIAGVFLFLATSIHQPSIAASTKNSPYDGFLFRSALHPDDDYMEAVIRQ